MVALLLCRLQPLAPSIVLGPQGRPVAAAAPDGAASSATEPPSPLLTLRRLLLNADDALFAWSVRGLCEELRAPQHAAPPRHASLLGAALVVSASSPLQLARLAPTAPSLLGLLCSHAAAAAAAANAAAANAAAAADGGAPSAEVSRADTGLRLCLQALTAATCNEGLRLEAADASAVLCAAACGVARVEARAAPAWLPSAAAFNAGYFLLLALLKQRMALVHRHGAPLLLAAVRGMLRAVGASQQLASASASAATQPTQPQPSHPQQPPPPPQPQREPLPLECTRNVRRLLEEISAKAHRKAFVRHAAYLLADVVALFVHRPPSPLHRAELLPGVHALLAMCTTPSPRARVH